MNKKKIIFALLFVFCGISIAHGAAKSFLKAQKFPETHADVSFVERMDAKRVGYEPFKDSSAYQQIEIESEEEYLRRQITKLEYKRQSDLLSMTNAQYCDKYPLDDANCVQTPGLLEATIAIGSRPTSTTQQQPGQQTQPGQSETQTIATTHPAPQPTTTTATITAQPQRITFNNRAHNGPCTPPQRSSHFSNQILTSGRYAQRDPAFEKALITMFRKEGGCSNHPDDTGGYTCYGISSAANPDIDVANITRADAEDISYNRYYSNYNLNQLPDVVRGDVFNFGFAAGPVTAIRAFSRTVGLSKRGRIDSEMISAAENYTADLHNDYMDALQNHFIAASEKGNNKVFLKGWMNSVKLLRENGCHSETTQPLTR